MLFNQKTLKSTFLIAVVCLLFCVQLVFVVANANQGSDLYSAPNLVITDNDVVEMRAAINQSGLFQDKYQALKDTIEQQMMQPIAVPVPKDGGGGYTHERHKKNYQLMYNAGVVYQISQQAKYADFVRDMLLEYVELYPTIGLHPKRKVKSQNPGKLFWQSLNEAVWLVYTIQAYDLIKDSLTTQEARLIEEELLKPVVIFLSEGQPSTFNKVHNHGTWATAGVGMAGYVMNEPEWVEKALYDLEKSGKGGFLRQIDELFSPQGYYNEGPYYQRYALMPFITFAKAIESNEPARKIFEYRDGLLLKAITTTIELSYNGLFFPINDAIKSKGIDTIELVHGVTVAFGLTGDRQLLDIANQQQQIILTGDGLKVAKALDAGLAIPYQFKSQALGDGADGKQGALVVMRQQGGSDQALLFKPASQGLGHGHFDKLTWQFYDKGAEIVSDYGAARFLNVEAKYGGRYLPENKSYAKQTVAHNTVVIDEISHFNANTKRGNKHFPSLVFFENNEHGSISSAKIDTAYENVELQRTVGLVKLPESDIELALDIFEVNSEKDHQIDLPLHYQGQLIDSNFTRHAYTDSLKPLGNKNGYQHLWLTAKSQPERGLAQITWLNDNGRFYTQSSLVDGDTSVMFTRLGANDPNFNLRNESAFIYRKQDTKTHRFVSVLEPHGQYNPAKEYTLSAVSSVTDLQHQKQDQLGLLSLEVADNKYLVVINHHDNLVKNTKFSYQGANYQFSGRFHIFKITKKQ